MSNIRTAEEIAAMRKSGEINAAALKKVLDVVRVGVTTRELDQIAEAEIKRLGGEISFRTVDDYQYTICATVNDQVVHGLPTEYALQAGDIVGIDIGAIYDGWHTDLAETVVVDADKTDEKAKKFLAVGKEALFAAIAQARDGNKVGDISHAMQEIVEKNGYAVVRALTGHGVGQQLHEEPMIPCFGKAGKGETLKAGMTIAVEVIYNQGKPDVQWESEDGWTISTVDGTLSGLFERSLLITDGEPEILTPIDELLAR